MDIAYTMRQCSDKAVLEEGGWRLHIAMQCVLTCARNTHDVMARTIKAIADAGEEFEMGRFGSYG